MLVSTLVYNNQCVDCEGQYACQLVTNISVEHNAGVEREMVTNKMKDGSDSCGKTRSRGNGR